MNVLKKNAWSFIGVALILIILAVILILTHESDRKEQTYLLALAAHEKRLKVNTGASSVSANAIEYYAETDTFKLTEIEPDSCELLREKYLLNCADGTLIVEGASGHADFYKNAINEELRAAREYFRKGDLDKYHEHMKKAESIDSKRIAKMLGVEHES